MEHLSTFLGDRWKWELTGNKTKLDGTPLQGVTQTAKEMIKQQTFDTGAHFARTPFFNSIWLFSFSTFLIQSRVE